MENRYYLYGKCIFSYDDDMFSSDAYHELIMEEFIHPIADNVYKKYYEKQLIQQTFEKVFKEDDIVFQVYCDIKPLIENEKFSGDYDDYIENLMREKLNFYKYENFEELQQKMILALNNAEIEFFSGDGSSMIEHFWRERGPDKKRRGLYF